MDETKIYSFFNNWVFLFFWVFIKNNVIKSTKLTLRNKFMEAL